MPKAPSNLSKIETVIVFYSWCERWSVNAVRSQVRLAGLMAP